MDTAGIFKSTGGAQSRVAVYVTNVGDVAEKLTGRKIVDPVGTRGVTMTQFGQENIKVGFHNIEEKWFLVHKKEQITVEGE